MPRIAHPRYAIEVTKRERGCSEAYDETQERPVLDQVKLEPTATRVLLEVHTQCAVAQEARIGYPMVGADLEAVSGERIPRELAARVKATDITPQHQIVARCQLLPEPQPDERINPLDIAGSGDCPASGQDQARGVERRRQCKIDVDALAPVPCPANRSTAVHPVKRCHLPIS